MSVDYGDSPVKPTLIQRVIQTIHDQFVLPPLLRKFFDELITGLAQPGRTISLERPIPFWGYREPNTLRVATPEFTYSLDFSIYNGSKLFASHSGKSSYLLISDGSRYHMSTPDLHKLQRGSSAFWSTRLTINTLETRLSVIAAAKEPLVDMAAYLRGMQVDVDIRPGLLFGAKNENPQLNGLPIHDFQVEYENDRYLFHNLTFSVDRLDGIRNPSLKIWDTLERTDWATLRQLLRERDGIHARFDPGLVTQALSTDLNLV